MRTDLNARHVPCCTYRLRGSPIVAAFAMLWAIACSPGDGRVGSQTSKLTGDAGELANAKAFINSTFYADGDIQYSFHTAVGEQIDCIDFYAQHSVKGLLAAGIPVIDPSHVPTPPAIPSTVPPVIKHSSTSVAFDGSLDSDGKARSCPHGTVPAMRPTVAEIETAGGLDAYKAIKHPLPTVDPNQDALQHDCYHQTTPGQGWDHASGEQYP